MRGLVGQFWSLAYELALIDFHLDDPSELSHVALHRRL